MERRASSRPTSSPMSRLSNWRTLFRRHRTRVSPLPSGTRRRRRKAAWSRAGPWRLSTMAQSSMSRQLVDHSPDLRRLEDEGYDLSIFGAETHLLLKVPYVNAQREVVSGMLVS